MRAEAERRGLTVQQYIEELKKEAMQRHQHQQQMQQQGGPQGGQGQQGTAQPIQPGPPKPEAIAVANFLKSQDLKPRTVIHDEKRKDMFRGTSHAVALG